MTPLTATHKSHRTLNISKSERQSKIDEAKAWTLYSEQLNDRKIAKKLRVSRTLIREWRLRHHLESWHNVRMHQRMLDVAKLWFDDLPISKIAKKLNIQPCTVIYITHKLRLPYRGRGWGRTQHLQSEERKKRLLGLKQKGLTYEQIAEKTNLPLRRVQEIIGLALIDQCRQIEACPYKALLPEYNTEASS